MASYLLLVGQSLNQNLNSNCVVCMKLFMTLGHFLATLTKPILCLSMHDQMCVRPEEQLFFSERGLLCFKVMRRNS